MGFVVESREMSVVPKKALPGGRSLKVHHEGEASGRTALGKLPFTKRKNSVKSHLKIRFGARRGRTGAPIA